MISSAQWQQANQEFIEIALERVRFRLALMAGTDENLLAEDIAVLDRRLVAATERMPAPSAFHQLCESFRLTDFEAELVLLCAAMETLPRFGDLCAACQGDPLLTFPTFGLAMAALPNPSWVAVSPAGVLRKLRLIEVEGGLSLVRNRIRISERLLHFLLGLDILEPSLPFITRCEPVDTPASAMALRLRDVTMAWVGHRARTMQIVGQNAERCFVEACQCIGLQPFRVDAVNLPEPIEEFADVWAREALLTTGALLVTNPEANLPAVTKLAARANFPLYLATSERVDLPDTVDTYLDPAPTAEVTDLWARALGDKAGPLLGELEILSETFRLNPDQIQGIADLAGGAPDVKAALWDGCRAATRRRLDQIAHRIQSQMRWADLVVADDTKAVLTDIASHVRNRSRVYGEWGFGERNVRGLGISALFAGPSGTGKTLAAEVIAGELNLDLYVIDLSQLVSKYIGETEKNLRRVFQAAEGAGAVLVFDEADAVFGQRSEVRDSHDRYANMEVSYLLQLTESYRGLVILTTNMRQSLDQAFMRRIRFVAHFAFPEYAQRRAMWERAFPERVPMTELDYDALAKLNLTGGNIRSIAINAAFRAAAEGTPVTMGQIAIAARAEFAKHDRPVPEHELSGDGW
ncbi:MAG: AAA family ATPase [Armatimonadetes bacterium]|nr:AAA family ATPase [Armatimonadota bacterium]